jgi:hypothetical protein
MWKLQPISSLSLAISWPDVSKESASMQMSRGVTLRSSGRRRRRRHLHAGPKRAHGAVLLYVRGHGASGRDSHKLEESCMHGMGKMSKREPVCCLQPASPGRSPEPGGCTVAVGSQTTWVVMRGAGAWTALSVAGFSAPLR